MNAGSLEGFPLSPPQQHVWRLREACAFPWNVGLRLAVEGPLEASELERALASVVAAEEVLRSGLRPLAGSSVGVQVIGSEPLLELTAERLPAGDGTAHAAALVERFERLLARPFELDRDPPAAGLRVALLTLADDAHELQLVQPAALADVASLEILAGRLAAALAGTPAARSSEEAGDDEDAPMQYADLAEWLQEMFESDEAPAGLGFWRRVDLSLVRGARLAFERSGPDHNLRFTVRVAVHGIGEAQATASSKQDAETLAAEEFLRKFA